eukprot:sb/3471858/
MRRHRPATAQFIQMEADLAPSIPHPLYLCPEHDIKLLTHHSKATELPSLGGVYLSLPFSNPLMAWYILSEHWPDPFSLLGARENCGQSIGLTGYNSITPAPQLVHWAKLDLHIAYRVCYCALESEMLSLLGRIPGLKPERHQHYPYVWGTVAKDDINSGLLPTVVGVASGRNDGRC